MLFCVSLMRQIYYWEESLVSAKRRRRAIPSFALSTNVTEGSTQRYAVTGLRPYTCYTMAITSYNSGGDGPESAEVKVNTSEPGRFKENYSTLLLVSYLVFCFLSSLPSSLACSSLEHSIFFNIHCSYSSVCLFVFPFYLLDSFSHFLFLFTRKNAGG